MGLMVLVRGDFNGVFGDILCLSHGETCRDLASHEVVLASGMQVTAFEDDSWDGHTEFLIASGLVETA